MAEFEKQRSAHKEGDAQEQPKVQKRSRRGAIRVIRLNTSPQTSDNMCNRTPPTPPRSITPDSPFIPSPPSSMSSNSRAVHYVTAAALYGQQQRRAAREQAAEEEEEEVAPEDSASVTARGDTSLLTRRRSCLQAGYGKEVRCTGLFQPSSGSS